MIYKFLCCILEKKDRNTLKDFLIKEGYIYNTDFKIKKDKSETFNFWILENHNKEELQDKIKERVFKPIEVLN